MLTQATSFGAKILIRRKTLLIVNHGCNGEKHQNLTEKLWKIRLFSFSNVESSVFGKMFFFLAYRVGEFVLQQCCYMIQTKKF